MDTTIVSVAWLNKHKDDPDLIVLDASLNSNKSNLISDYPNLQIKDAQFFDLKNIFSDQFSEIPNSIPSPNSFAKNCRKLGINTNSKLVVYDNLGIYSSPRVWWMFKTMGHQNVAVLDGGLPAWIQEELPIEERSVIPITAGNFEANYQEQLIVDSSYILENLEHGTALVLDARAEERFRGLVPEPRAHLKTGHIPRAINIPFKQVLQKGHLKPKPALIQFFETLSIDNRPLIASCGSGITACILLLACKVSLSNSLALYDGSWSEWGGVGNFPIETDKE